MAQVRTVLVDNGSEQFVMDAYDAGESWDGKDSTLLHYALCNHDPGDNYSAKFFFSER